MRRSCLVALILAYALITLYPVQVAAESIEPTTFFYNLNELRRDGYVISNNVKCDIIKFDERGDTGGSALLLEEYRLGKDGGQYVSYTVVFDLVDTGSKKLKAMPPVRYVKGPITPDANFTNTYVTVVYNSSATKINVRAPNTTSDSPAYRPLSTSIMCHNLGTGVNVNSMTGQTLMIGERITYPPYKLLEGDYEFSHVYRVQAPVAGNTYTQNKTLSGQYVNILHGPHFYAVAMEVNLSTPSGNKTFGDSAYIYKNF